MSDASKIDDGGSAFPVLDSSGGGVLYCQDAGLSRRDYFAAAALTGMLANSENVHAGAEPTNGCLFLGKMFAEYAELAVKMADALIAASKSEAHHG